VVGWSFGGYAALLGAVRNSDLFHCSVSIAGISDLSLLEQEANSHLNNAIAREQIGTDLAKLKADSPRRHADAVQVSSCIPAAASRQRIRPAWLAHQSSSMP
jgi:dipeptidyl aminopeptidase/acylaminoacyl peptidase